MLSSTRVLKHLNNQLDFDLSIRMCSRNFTAVDCCEVCLVESWRCVTKESPWCHIQLDVNFFTRHVQWATEIFGNTLDYTVPEIPGWNPGYIEFLEDSRFPFLYEF